MIVNTTYARDTVYIAAFLRRYLPELRSWDKDGTLKWVKWFMCHGRALMIKDGRKLVGVAMVRLVDTREQAETNYADTGGTMAYVEVAAGRKGIIPHLFALFRQTFPCAATIAWARSKYDNRPCVIPMHKALLRLS